MKGLAAMTIGLIGLIFTITAVAMILLPPFFLKVHLVKTVNVQYKYDNSQLALISLLSSTHKGKETSQIIGEYIVLDQPKDLDSVLSDKLDKVVESGCYKLSIESEIATETPDCNPGYATEVSVPLPYNEEKLIEEIELVID